MSGTSVRRANRMRGRAEAAEEEMSSERWLLTYADMITLLFVLFIVLFALSKVNEAKYRQFQESLAQNKIVGVSLDKGTTTNAPKGPKPLTATPDQLHQLAKVLRTALAKKGLASSVSLTTTTNGLVIGLVGGSAFFQTDSAALSARGIAVVDTTGQTLKTRPASIEVAGYTDDEPITGGPFSSNWDLAAARSTSVVERMTTVDGIDPSLVVAVSYGQYHPVASNTTPAGQAQNRRVNIIVSAGTSTNLTLGS